jgi:SAM-dependent methyltransferase
LAEHAYAGTELELFAEARRWKERLARELGPYLRGHVLEVGAGLGGTTRALVRAGGVRAWTALEPDAVLRARLEEAARALGAEHGIPVRARGETMAELDASERFDAIAYVDVLEHIADDRRELALAAEHLAPGGRLLVLAPAHAVLFSEFDRHVGHHRRYDRRSLRALAPPGLALARLRYLDSVGLLASLANRLLLRAPVPTRRQVRLWDGWMVPASGVLDRLSFGSIGKSVLAVWRRLDN